MKACTLLLAPALLLFSSDALAWGLQTHLFFAQQVLFAAPLLDPAFRRAALRLPRLLLAGACLPDLSLAGRALGTALFQSSHHWATLRRFSAVTCDEERAIAVGYASHLVADVVAHNQFVPEHESRIGKYAYVTHALSEWAMDHHVRQAVFANVGDLLDAECATLSAVVARHLRCGEAMPRRAIVLLARADRLFRHSPIPRLCRSFVRRFDHHMALRFEAYVRETAAQFAHIGAVLDGAVPDAEAEPAAPTAIAAGSWRAGRLLPPSSLA